MPSFRFPEQPEFPNVISVILRRYLTITVSVRFHPIGSAPILKQKIFKISASSRFSVVLNFLRKRLGIREGDGLFCYVNSVFAPGLDEGVGNLYRVCILYDPRIRVKKCQLQQPALTKLPIVRLASICYPSPNTNDIPQQTPCATRSNLLCHGRLNGSLERLGHIGITLVNVRWTRIRSIADLVLVLFDGSKSSIPY